MPEGWRRTVIFCIASYSVLHVLYYVSCLFSITYESRVFTDKDLSDGPLLWKPRKLGKNQKNVIQAVALLNPSAFDPPAEDSDPNATLPTISEQFSENLTSLAAKIHKQHDDFVYFTFVNPAYERLTLNWLCNVAEMGSTLNRTLIVATAASVCDQVRHAWQEVHCLSLSLSSYKGALDWGKQSYINMLTMRMAMMKRMVEASLPFVLFETDAVWLRDPAPLIANRTVVEDADIIVPVKGYEQKGLTLAFDPMVVLPTNGTRELFTEMESRLEGDKKLYDQDVLDSLCTSQWRGVVCRTFEYDQVADGKWFKLSEAERLRQKTRPFIANNNFYVGVGNKETRQALNGMWFLSGKNNFCMKTKVRKLLAMYKK